MPLMPDDQRLAYLSDLGGLASSEALAAALIRLSAAEGEAAQALGGGGAHRNVFLAGVIRNNGAPNYWELLPISTNHRPVNIDSIETLTDTDGVNGSIRVNYSSLGAKTTVAFLAVPDETLATAGFMMGTSVTESSTVIRMSQAARDASDYVYYDAATSSWKSYDGVFNNITYDPVFGILSLTHTGTKIPLESQYAISVVPRGAGFRYSASSGGSPTSVTKIDLMVTADEVPEMAGYIYWDTATSTWKSSSPSFTFTGDNAVDFAAGTLTINHPSIPSTDAEKAVVNSRGAYSARVSAAGSPLSSLQTKLSFYNAAGTLVTAPDANCRAYLRRGGSPRTIPAAPSSGMKLYVSHGGGTRRVHPKDIDTTLYPSSNIWLFGIMEMPD